MFQSHIERKHFFLIYISIVENYFNVPSHWDNTLY